MCIDQDAGGPAGLEQAELDLAVGGRRIRDEAEVVERAPTERVGVRVGGVGNRLPGHVGRRRSARPIGVVVRFAGVTVDVVESDVGDLGHGRERHRERSTGQVAIQVEHGVLVGPRAVVVVDRVAADDEQALTRNEGIGERDARVLLLPSTNGRVLGVRLTREAQVPGAARERTDVDVDPCRVVETVARGRVIRCDVLALAVVRSRRVQARTQFVRHDLAALVDRVARRALREEGVGVRAQERVDLALGAEPALVAVQARTVRIGTTDAEQGTRSGVGAVAAQLLGEREEAVLQPRLAELFEATVLEAVDVLPDDRVVGRARDPVQVGVAEVARRRSDRVCGDRTDGTPVRDSVERADDDVRACGRVRTLGRR